jgi:methyl acetate hydrolase
LLKNLHDATGFKANGRQSGCAQTQGVDKSLIAISSLSANYAAFSVIHFLKPDPIRRNGPPKAKPVRLRRNAANLTSDALKARYSASVALSHQEELMAYSLKAAADAVLNKAVNSKAGVPGVSAIITDRNGNIYEGAAGKRQLGGSEAMTPDSVCAIFSTTKAITGTACLQLVEDGGLDLDAPAKKHAPEIGKLQVLDGFDAAGNPKLRAPKRDITTRMLLLHTAGFGYDFFNENYNRMAQNHGQPSVITSTHAAIRTPLLFDPGDEWEYGSNIDWAGQVVEGIAGKRLGEVMQERILGPLGMDDTAFVMNASMRKRMATMHQRDDKGVLTPMPDFTLPQEPEVHMGGHGLYSTALDYGKFIRMWLNDGAGGRGRVLKKQPSRWPCRTA